MDVFNRRETLPAGMDRGSNTSGPPPRTTLEGDMIQLRPAARLLPVALALGLALSGCVWGTAEPWLAGEDLRAVLVALGWRVPYVLNHPSVTNGDLVRLSIPIPFSRRRFLRRCSGVSTFRITPTR